jgi:hypothetical protein
MRRTERRTPARPMPERLKRGAVRALAHGAVLIMWATTLGAAVLWPRWSQWQGAQSSLQIQTVAGADLRDRLLFLQTTQRFYEQWSAHRRRALLPSEVPGFCAELKRLLRGTGAQVLSLRRDPVVQVPPVPEPLDPQTAGPGVFTGTVQAMPVTLVLEGGFPAIYRSVARLEGQRFLAIVRGAEMTRLASSESAVAGPPPAPAAARIKASLSIHLFVLQSDETDPLTARVPAPSPLTAGAAS